MIIKDEERITKQPLVTVQVFAYNKEAYIRQCLDSIVNQKADFEFEVIVSENPGNYTIKIEMRRTVPPHASPSAGYRTPFAPLYP